MTPWVKVSADDKRALAVVDGLGEFFFAGPHYSRRTPGARKFVGCGKSLVLISRCGKAVWSVVYQKTPPPAGTRGVETPKVWRNNVFRNLGAGLSSDLIRYATDDTFAFWELKYGETPPERLRTEIKVNAVRSSNPGYCYLKAGWERGEIRNGIRFYYAP